MDEYTHELIEKVKRKMNEVSGAKQVKQANEVSGAKQVKQANEGNEVSRGRKKSENLDEYLKKMELRMHEILKDENDDLVRQEIINNHLKIIQGVEYLKKI